MSEGEWEPGKCAVWDYQKEGDEGRTVDLEVPSGSTIDFQQGNDLKMSCLVKPYMRQSL